MNRALAQKMRKAKDQRRDRAIRLDMVVRSQPTTTKSFNRWLDNQVWIASNPRDVKHLRGRRPTPTDALSTFLRVQGELDAVHQDLSKITQMKQTKMIGTGRCRLQKMQYDRAQDVEGSWSTTRYECMLEIAIRTQWETVHYGLPFNRDANGMSRRCATSATRYVIREELKKVPMDRVEPYWLARDADNAMAW